MQGENFITGYTVAPLHSQGNGSRSREVRVIVINQPGNALVLFVRRQARRSQNKLLMGLGVTEFHAGAESAVVQG